MSVPILGILRVVLMSVPEFRPWGELLSEREAVPTVAGP